MSITQTEQPSTGETETPGTETAARRLGTHDDGSGQGFHLLVEKESFHLVASLDASEPDKQLELKAFMAFIRSISDDLPPAPTDSSDGIQATSHDSDCRIALEVCLHGHRLRIERPLYKREQPGLSSVRECARSRFTTLTRFLEDLTHCEQEVTKT